MRRFRLLGVACGALLLQASFSQERRQAMGFAAALAPLAALWPPGDERRQFFRRHLENFNTNPAMAGPILGAVARLEEDAAGGDRTALGRIARVKRGLEGPFASAGDSLLWSGLRPACGTWGSVLAWLAGAPGPVFLLVAYNAVHLGIRMGGVFQGYARGEGIASLLQSGARKRGARVLPWVFAAGALLLGALVLGGCAGVTLPLLGLAAAGVGVVLGSRASIHGTLAAAGAMITGLVLARWVGASP